MCAECLPGHHLRGHCVGFIRRLVGNGGRDRSGCASKLRPVHDSPGKNIVELTHVESRDRILGVHDDDDGVARKERRRRAGRRGRKADVACQISGARDGIVKRPDAVMRGIGGDDRVHDAVRHRRTADPNVQCRHPLRSDGEKECDQRERSSGARYEQRAASRPFRHRRRRRYLRSRLGRRRGGHPRRFRALRA